MIRLDKPEAPNWPFARLITPSDELLNPSCSGVQYRDSLPAAMQTLIGGTTWNLWNWILRHSSRIQEHPIDSQWDLQDKSLESTGMPENLVREISLGLTYETRSDGLITSGSYRISSPTLQQKWGGGVGETSSRYLSTGGSGSTGKPCSVSTMRSSVWACEELTVFHTMSCTPP